MKTTLVVKCTRAKLHKRDRTSLQERASFEHMFLEYKVYLAFRENGEVVTETDRCVPWVLRVAGGMVFKAEIYGRVSCLCLGAAVSDVLWETSH